MTAVEKVKWDHVIQRIYPHGNRVNELTSQLGKKKKKKGSRNTRCSSYNTERLKLSFMSLLSKSLFSQSTKTWDFALVCGRVFLSPHTAPGGSTTGFREVPSQVYCNSIVKFSQSWSLKYIFPSKQYSTAWRNWLKADFFSFLPISPLLIFNTQKQKIATLKIKMEIEIQQSIELFFLFPRWLPTARTLTRFQGCHFFKEEAKKSNSGEKSQNCKVENQLLSIFLMNFLSFTMLCDLKLFKVCIYVFCY